jgi:CDP-4-dehydro-6-deoxyglucose reductase
VAKFQQQVRNKHSPLATKHQTSLKASFTEKIKKIVPTYKIKIQSSGLEFHVKPSQTILEGAIASGITLPYGCQDGACGSCKGKVISGKYFLNEYQSSALTDSDIKAGNTLYCKSMAQEDLVIEPNIPEVYDQYSPKVYAC